MSTSDPVRSLDNGDGIMKGLNTGDGKSLFLMNTAYEIKWGFPRFSCSSNRDNS